MSSDRCAADDLTGLTAGIIKRAELITSCRIFYSVRGGFKQNAEPAQPARNIQLSFQKPSWAVRYEPWGRVDINHGGKFLVYDPNKQPDGSIVPGAQFFQPRPIERESPTPPFFAGTLWYKSTINFIKSSKGGKLVASDHLKSLSVHSVEWSVPKEDLGRAFHLISPGLAGGGRLRVTVLPDQGFVLSKIEYLTSLGMPGIVFESKDFVDYQGVAFFPRICRQQSFRADGTPGHFIEYDIERVELLNEKIPESDFRVTLPLGTVVNDARAADGKAIFTVGEVKSAPQAIADLIELEKGALPQPFVQQGRKWSRNAIIVVVNASILALILTGIVVRAWYKNRMKARGEL